MVLLPQKLFPVTMLPSFPVIPTKLIPQTKKMPVTFVEGGYHFRRQQHHRNMDSNSESCHFAKGAVNSCCKSSDHDWQGLTMERSSFDDKDRIAEQISVWPTLGPKEEHAFCRLFLNIPRNLGNPRTWRDKAKSLDCGGKRTNEITPGHPHV